MVFWFLVAIVCFKLVDLINKFLKKDSASVKKIPVGEDYEVYERHYGDW